MIFPSVYLSIRIDLVNLAELTFLRCTDVNARYDGTNENCADKKKNENMMMMVKRTSAANPDLCVIPPDFGEGGSNLILRIILRLMRHQEIGEIK